jgi:hypothetical protein
MIQLANLRTSFIMAVVTALIPLPLSAGAITFHTERGIIAGNGCPEGSSRVYTDEYGDLLIEHDDLAIRLYAGGTDRTLSARVACSIRIPVTVAKGFYVKSIEQVLNYSVLKSAGASASIATQTSFSLDMVGPFSVALSRGATQNPEIIVESRLDHLESASQIQRYCNPARADELMLRINLAISGSRRSTAQDLIVQAFGGYLGEGLEVKLGLCP